MIHNKLPNAQNFYLLKIHLNFFEISNWVLKFKNLISIIILSENSFQTWILRTGAMCVYSSLSHGKVEYTHIEPLCKVHIWNKFSDRIIQFEKTLKIALKSPKSTYFFHFLGKKSFLNQTKSFLNQTTYVLKNRL